MPFCVRAGADEHGQAGPGAPSAVIRRGHRGGEVGGAGTRHRPAEPEPGQYGIRHVSVHQVTAQPKHTTQKHTHMLTLHSIQFSIW